MVAWSQLSNLKMNRELEEENNMSDRMELLDNDLDKVVGGALKWKGNGTVYPKDNPDAVRMYRGEYMIQYDWAFFHAE